MLILEFNELSPSLLTRYIDGGALPNFKRLRDGSSTFITRTCDEELQPWVQWPTFHHGRPLSSHGVRNLDESHRLPNDALWDELAAVNKRTLLFGAMNAQSNHPLVDFLPDAWNSQAHASDSELRTMERFVKAAVQEHTNPFKSFSATQLGDLGLFLFTKGLRISTAAHAASHLLRERVSRRDIRWKRAAIFDMLAWDVFKKRYKRTTPTLAIFFGNSTAHLQHRYWRQMEPEAYEVKPSRASIQAYGAAILHGYKGMDQIVGEAFSMCDANTSIVLATGLSQHANPDRKNTPGQVAYRPHDFGDFLRAIDIQDFVAISPLMTHFAWVDFPTTAATQRAVGILEGLRLEGAPAMLVDATGTRLRFSCNIGHKVSPDVTLETSNGTLRFFDFFSPAGDTILDGSHHRDGVLWIHGARDLRAEKDTVMPLENCKALLLDVLGIPRATSQPQAALAV